MPFRKSPAYTFISNLPESLEARAWARASVHAKIIVADEEVVYLSSANFTGAAFLRNIEAGLKLKDSTLGKQLTDHFDRLIRDRVVTQLVVD